MRSIPLKRLVLTFLIVFALSPVSLFAAPLTQDGGLDDASLDAIAAGAALVYGGGAPRASVVDTPDDSPGAPKTGAIDELAPVASSEMTMDFPANWEVDVDEDGNLYAVDLGGDLFGIQVENFGEDAPGLFMLPIFESQADFFAQSMGGDVAITDISHLLIGDNLPALRLSFSGTPERSVPLDGVVYIVTAGKDGYGIYAVGDSEHWSTYGPLADEIVQSMVVDPERITLQYDAQEAIELQEANGAYSIALPPGWYGSTSDDETLGLLVADPEIKFVGALGLSPQSDIDDPMLRSLIEGIAGNMSSEATADLLETLLGELDFGDSDVVIDETQTTVFPSDAEGVMGILRVGGEAPIEENLILPVTLYVSVFTDRAGALVIFGEPEVVRSFEPELVTILESLQPVE